MRLTLDDTPRADLVVADDGSTVSGVAVPWDEVGHTSAGPVRFVRGSVGPGDTPYPVPFCLDHDTTRPVGVVAQLDDDEQGLRFVAALDPIPAAEHARAQMRSRSRSGVSVSVDVIDHELDEDGTLVVRSGELVELSSVVRPAFRSARVAAHERQATMSETLAVESTASSKTKTKSDEAPDDTPARVPQSVNVAPTRSLPTVSAFAAEITRRVRAAGPDTARDVARIMGQVEQGQLTAALSDVTRTELPPPGTYLSELDNLTRFGMPLVDAFTVVPTDRWPVMQHQVKTWPTAGTQSADKAAIASTPVEFEWANVTDATAAHGVDVSLQAIDDNGEQVLSDVFEVTSEAVGNLIDAAGIAAVDAAASAGGTSVTLDTIGAALGTVVGAGLGSPVIVCAPDVWGKLWSLTSGGGPALARLAGLDMAPPVIADNQITAGVAYVGAKRAVKTYLSREARLRAVEVSLLGLNVGQYRRHAFRVVHPSALVKITSA